MQTRTCANCAAFNQGHTADEPMCWNLVVFSDSKSEYCDLHKTIKEDASETVFIEENRDEILRGIHAMAFTHELLAKFRA